MNQSAINDYWADVVARYRASPLPGFLRWWGGELSSLIPDSLRQRLVQPRPAVWLLPAEDGSLAVWAGGEAPEHLDTFGPSEDAGLLRDRWSAVARSFEEGNPEVRLCLPEDDILQCPVELPLAVESGLQQALRYQLDQFTPFQADQVYYAHEVTGRDSAHGRLKLALRLVPVSSVDRWRERLAAIGVRPHAIDVAASGEETPSPLGVNLLPEAERPPYVYKRARLNWMLAAGLVAMLVLVMAQSIYLRERSVDQLQAEVDSLREQSETVVALQRQLEDSLTAANFLAELRRRQPVVIQVLDEVTRLLPDDIWLQQLQVRDNELHMQGLADGSQRLIDLINDSELLDDAEFRGSVNVDQATGRERFATRAQIQTGRARNAAVAESGE
ncbi:PilN domain-containing protein [Wenzhouxiangella sp. AB-CW3]|uniref:PilN domain-containing protein n=1 Tax=Wenzhouxiangella sp. AB-CW3 TaxID=2771012 RepID=UPI00168ABEFD|nr:PilN domain-containing protein [Wenzhouxiangella sp. AB-CW3]QOC23047.1 PilN domain-containing protein [Wenzhouxiangella sp. AB-CW3]